MKDEVYLKMLGAAVWESPVPIYVIHVEVDAHLCHPCRGG